MRRSKEYIKLYEELIQLRLKHWDTDDYKQYYLDMVLDVDSFREAHDNYIWNTYDIESVKESLEEERLVAEHVKHKDEIFEELLNTYRKCLNRKVRSSISDEQYGYAKALEWVLGLDKDEEAKKFQFIYEGKEERKRSVVE